MYFSCMYIYLELYVNVMYEQYVYDINKKILN